MKVVIMAGGKGTRISALSKEIPKPLLRLEGKPVLEHQIEYFRRQGFNEFILTVGYLGNKIIEYFGDGSKNSPVTGQPFGVHIDYYIEQEPLGNAGALFRLKDKLQDDFLLINGDLIFDVDFQRFVEFHKKQGAMATLFTHPNDHPYDSGLIIADENGQVGQWLTKEERRPEFYKNRVNAGLHIISPKILEISIQDKKVDLDRQLLKPLVETGRVYCYDSPEYVKDMGTPERYHTVSSDLKSGKVARKNLKHRQRAVFLDRDGTINQYVGFLRKAMEFELIEGVAEAVRKINAAGYLAIVVTNQPVLARGEVTYDELEEIHKKMETLLGFEGAYLDAIYVCPHHPDKGFEGEVTELKIKCECRKPKPGMILEAAEKYNIDLQESWIIGDSKNDIEAGKASGCKTVLIDSQKLNYGQDITVSSLFEFAEKYIYLI